MSSQSRIFRRMYAFLLRRLEHSVHVKTLLHRAVWCLPESWRYPYKVREALRDLAEYEKNVFFLNIGANDGLTDNPQSEFIITKRWSGILVEPVDYVFDRLTRVYRNTPRVILENAAIAETTGTRPFWYLRENRTLPAGYHQIGSFNKDHLLGLTHVFPDLEKYLVSRDVECMTLQDLLQKHNVKCIDFVLVDTEGYDYKIIRQIDFDRFRPRLIIFESLHLKTNEKEQCYALLASNGYSMFEVGNDTVARLEILS